jgi:hypothetical protein
MPVLGRQLVSHQFRNRLAFIEDRQRTFGLVEEDLVVVDVEHLVHRREGNCDEKHRHKCGWQSQSGQAWWETFLRREKQV